MTEWEKKEKNRNQPIQSITMYIVAVEANAKGKLNWIWEGKKKLKNESTYAREKYKKMYTKGVEKEMMEKKCGTLSALILSASLFFWLANRTKSSIQTQHFLPWTCTAVQPNP